MNTLHRRPQLARETGLILTVADPDAMFAKALAAGGRPMKAYVMTTGAVFGLLTLAHLWRIIEERHLATNPWHLLITVAAAALCLWAWRLLRLSARS